MSEAITNLVVYLNSILFTEELLKIYAWWGGGFYLSNKFFRMLTESTTGTKKKWFNIFSWAVFTIGMPGWLLIFVYETDWIAAGLQMSALPAVFVGLLVAMEKTKNKKRRWLDWVTAITVAAGVAGSYYEHDGIRSINQGLEISLTIGALIGTYYLAREQRKGYYWYMLLNASCATLMFREGHPVLFVQQVISLTVVIVAYFQSKRNGTMN